MRIPPPSRRRGKLSRARAADAALVLIDFQPQMFMGVESHDRATRSRTTFRSSPRARSYLM
jgi:hypothetical protein